MTDYKAHLSSKHFIGSEKEKNGYILKTFFSERYVSLHCNIINHYMDNT